MSEEQVTPESQPVAEASAPEPQATPEPKEVVEAPSAAAMAAAALVGAWKTGTAAPSQDKPPSSPGGQPRGERPPRPPQAGRESRPPREGGNRPQGQGERREGRPGGDRPPGDRGPRPGGDRAGGDRGGGDRAGGDRGGDRRDSGRPAGRPDMFGDIELEKLLSDSLYLDNQAHAVVSRMRDMDSGTRSQLRRLYGAVRRANRAPDGERQHEFVMLRARLAYTIARHGLRSLDQIERLLLQVTRKNEARGYERFRDLFEAIVAYNE